MRKLSDLDPTVREDIRTANNIIVTRTSPKVRRWATGLVSHFGYTFVDAPQPVVLKNLRKFTGIEYRDCTGYSKHDDKSVYINDGLHSGAWTKILLHEIAHIVYRKQLYSDYVPAFISEKDYYFEEVIVEKASMDVCELIGIDSFEFTLKYIDIYGYSIDRVNEDKVNQIKRDLLGLG